MRELRTEENSKFEKFFEFIRNEAKKENKIFFVECGEGRELFTDDLEGEDLMGWLIPISLADKFEPEWKTGDVSEKWNNYVRFSVWELIGDDVKITFKEY